MSRRFNHLFAGAAFAPYAAAGAAAFAQPAAAPSTHSDARIDELHMEGRMGMMQMVRFAHPMAPMPPPSL